MKCPNCNGTGYVEYFDRKNNNTVSVPCYECKGTGYVEQTNEEWFCGLSTEEKAVFMTLFSLRRANVYNKTIDKTAADSANEAAELTVGTKKLKAYKELLAWLKGKHIENEKSVHV